MSTYSCHRNRRSTKESGYHEETTTRTHRVDFHPVIVTATTEHRASLHILASPALRIVRADEVRSGDLIVSAFDPTTPGHYRRTAYFASGPYPASPGPYDPTCGCGTCGPPEAEGPQGTVVLARDCPWECCDPWPADDLVLIRPNTPPTISPRKHPCPNT